MSQLWTITELATGKVLYAAFQTPSVGSHPKDNGWAWDAATQKATRISAAPDTLLQAFNGTIWADDLAKVKANLVANLKAEAERRKMLNATAGGYKKTEYSEKAQEVAAYDNSGSTVTAILTAIGLIPAGQKAVRFKWALASQAAFGEPTISPAIERFRGGVTRASINPRIGAVEEKATLAIKAATTVAAAREAATVTWPTT